MKPPTLTAPVQVLVFLLAGWISGRQQLAIGYLQAENQVLRQRLGSSRLRFTDGERRLLAEKAEPRGRGALAELATLATPDTILRWYRELVAAKYDAAKQRRSPGRPATERDVTEQLLTMARENPSWRYTRLRGALHDLRFDVARSTIQALLRRNHRQVGLVTLMCSQCSACFGPPCVSFIAAPRWYSRQSIVLPELGPAEL